jgi:hypothetical protein
MSRNAEGVQNNNTFLDDGTGILKERFSAEISCFYVESGAECRTTSRESIEVEGNQKSQMM